MDIRTRILDAALGLLAQGGARELTQPRVAKAAGVRQSHLTYYFPTIHDLVLAVVMHTLDAIRASVGEHAPAQRPASLADGFAAVSSDKRRVRMMLGLVTAADREPRLKPRVRELVTTLRHGLAPLLRAAGLRATPDEVAFIHSVVIGQAVLQLARDDDDARREARRILERAVRYLRRKE